MSINKDTVIEFIDKINNDKSVEGLRFNTQTDMIIGLGKIIKELEARVKALEEVRK